MSSEPVDLSGANPIRAKKREPFLQSQPVDLLGEDPVKTKKNVQYSEPVDLSGENPVATKPKAKAVYLEWTTGSPGVLQETQQLHQFGLKDKDIEELKDLDTFLNGKRGYKRASVKLYHDRSKSKICIDGAEVIVGSSGSSFKKAAKDAIKKVKAAS